MRIKKRIKNFVPESLLSLYHFGWALLSALFYRFPGREITVIGVTGTNGKTTTVRIIGEVLREAGFKVALLSSLRFEIGERREENKLRMTMPGRGFIQGFLRRAVREGCRYAVVEVTSEGVAQHRHRFLGFKTAVLTNLSPEHIESHGSFKDYRAAKGRFFKSVKGTHILNREEQNFSYFDKFPARRRYYYDAGSVRGPDFNFRVSEKEVSGRGVDFKIEEAEFRLPLAGGFNFYNGLAAVCVGLSEGVSLEKVLEGLKRVRGVPGRMEFVIEDPFKAVVDYAFTPRALEEVYRFLGEEIKEEEGGMACVLGACGGGRDRWKRPVLGKLAAEYCDRVIVTNEDPYDEDPEEIMREVAEGAGEKAELVRKRRAAIRKALSGAKKGDVVIVTGKGAEPSMVVKGEKIPWDDREVLRREYEKLYG